MAIQKWFVPLALVLALCYFEEIAGYGEYYVRVKDKSQRRSFAGSILSPTLILVAARSVANTSLYNPTSLLVCAGVTSDKPEETLQIRRATDVFIFYPELYSEYNHEYDFAGIITDRPFDLNDYVRIIPFSCSYTQDPAVYVTSIVLDNIYPDRYAEEVRGMISSDAAECLAYYGGTLKTASCGFPSKGFDNFDTEKDIGTAVVQNGFLVGIIIIVPYENDRKYQKRPLLGTDFSKVCALQPMITLSIRG